MLTLIIDTTGDESRVELVRDATVIAKELWQSEKRLGDDLLPRIADVLNQKGFTARDVDLIQVCPGPGSFTGTRVGVSVANALGWALNIPVVSVNDPNLAGAALKRAFTQPVAPVYDVGPSIVASKPLSAITVRRQN